MNCMSPEVMPALNSQDYSNVDIEKCDVYSLGLVVLRAYYLLI